MENIVDPVFSRIDALMKAQGIKQTELINHLKIRRTSYSEWKSGISRTYMTHIVEICDYLHASPNFILKGKEELGNELKQMTQEEEKILELYRSLKKKQKTKLLQLIRIVFD